MKTNRFTRRQALGGVAGTALAGLLTMPALARGQRPGGISSPPITLNGRIVGRPIREAFLPAKATHFVGGRVTGYTTFQLVQNQVLADFLAVAPNGPCTMRCVVFNVPGDPVLWVEAISIFVAEDERLPNREATLEQEPLTSQEEEALHAFMVMTFTSMFDNPDSSSAARIQEQHVAGFDGRDIDPAFQDKMVALPTACIEDATTGLVKPASLKNLVDEDPGDGIDPCLYAIGKAILFFLFQLIIGVLSPPMRAEIAAQGRRLAGSPIGPALTRLLNVFQARGLKGNARGDLLRGALTNLIVVGAVELGTSAVEVLKKTAWYRFAPAVAKALGFIAAVASFVMALIGLSATMWEIHNTCRRRLARGSSRSLKAGAPAQNEC